MCLRFLKRFQKTIGFRLTVWYSGIFIISTLILFAIAYFLLSSSLSRQDHNSIQLKLKELSALYQAGGIDQLKREIAIDKKFLKKSPFFIRLSDGKNNTLLLILPYQWLEFDLKKLENIEIDEGIKWLYLPIKEDGYELEVGSFLLSKGYLLQVGKSNEDREKILRKFREIFSYVIIPLILFGFMGGSFVAYRALLPIRHLISTVRAIESGEMGARVPSPQTADELEELIMLFNNMVIKIESLIKGIRDSLDNVAHDLRTPMTRFRGIAEMALQSDQKPETLREALSDSLEESERILTILDTLLDISEAETGVMKLDVKMIDIKTLIDDVVEIYLYVAEGKDIDIHIRVPDGINVNADPARLSQALANLLDNAIKYTPNKGEIELESCQLQGKVVITVRDTGIGIPQEELPRIWDRLYRGDQSRSQKGFGLGLNLVKAIVHAHKGQVEVLSEPNKGSTFRIILPA